MRAFVCNFDVGRRGPSSAVLLEDDQGVVFYGAVFWSELPGGSVVNTPAWAVRYLEDPVNMQMVLEGLQEPFDPDDAIVPGFAKNPQTDLAMRQLYMNRAGWD